MSPDDPPPEDNSDHTLLDSVPNNSKAAFLNSIFLPETSIDSEENNDNESPALNCRYYDTDSLSQLLKDCHSSGLSLFHLNIASLPLHIDDLNSLLFKLDHQFSIIGISETKIQSSTIPESSAIAGYQYLHTPSKSSKGGAALFIRNDLNFSARNDLSTLCYSENKMESCFAELPSLAKCDPGYIVGTIYKHPSMDSKEFRKILKKLLHQTSVENKRLILLGDFNINLLNASTDDDVIKFIDLLSCYLLLPTINIPTRLTSSTKTLIDNIYCNYSDPNFVSGNIITCISDHLPQFLITPNCKSISKPTSDYSYKDWSKFNQDQFLHDYSKINCNETLKLHCQNVDTSFKSFIDTLNNLIDKHLPTKVFKNKKYRQKLRPWITPGIIKSMSIRDKLYQTFIHCKNPVKKQSFENRYKFYRNTIVSLCRRSKISHYSNFFNNNLNNSKKMWGEINSLINNKSKSDNVKCILIDNVLSSNPGSIAKAFNSYFTHVADTIRSKIPYSHKHFSDFLPRPNNHSFFLADCDADEVMWNISVLNPNKATGPCSIPGQILDLLKSH